jgi:hypothetical protein
VRQSYLIDVYSHNGRNPAAIDLVQGAAEDLTLFLRGRERWEQLYERSTPRRLYIAGAEREAWLMSGRGSTGINGQLYLFVEIDGTLLIVHNPFGTLDQPMLDALAQLEQYTAP